MFVNLFSDVMWEQLTTKALLHCTLQPSMETGEACSHERGGGGREREREEDIQYMYNYRFCTS